MNEGILKTEKLTHVYSPGTPFEMVAVRDVDIEIRKGEVLGIIGHTGSGKSTLIQHFNALVKPSSGRVLLEGRDINESKETIKDARAKVGLVFQYPEYQLFEETVYKDIAFGPKNMKLSESEIDERVRKAARFVGVEEELLDRSPFDLSGGQKRRVAIAGVIAMMPEVLVLDEPMAGLDPQGREEIMANILSYHEETGAAIVIVTHSMEEAARYTDRMIVLNHGTVAMEGTPEEVFSRGEELRSIGLATPVMSDVAEKLRKKGLDVPASVYTVEQMVRALTTLERGRRGA